jgi:hypothetical protein|tara:strand:+ start:173 stop:280 length:108 start_codon:yes stop_codon:yes gene_type:complete
MANDKINALFEDGENIKVKLKDKMKYELKFKNNGI